MAKSVVISRIKTQLIRKRAIIHTPTTVKIVIRPSKAQVRDLRDINKPIQQTKPAIVAQNAPQPVQIAPAPKRNVPSAVVSRQELIKQRRVKKTQVRYITADPNPEAIGRIIRIRNIGKNKILIIVGNGPSITEAALDQLKGHSNIEILSVNKPDQRLWPTEYWSFFDQSQFKRHEDLWNGFNGWIFNSTAIKRQKATSMQFKNLANKGWSRDLLKGLHIGRSTVFASMQIATWLNHEHVYIFGCDMNPEGLNGKLHFYGQNPDVDPAVRRERFEREADYYDHAADLMTPEERSKFTFCSEYNPWPFVTKFNKLNHKEAIEHILDHAKRL